MKTRLQTRLVSDDATQGCVSGTARDVSPTCCPCKSRGSVRRQAVGTLQASACAAQQTPQPCAPRCHPTLFNALFLCARVITSSSSRPPYRFPRVPQANAREHVHQHAMAHNLGGLLHTRRGRRAGRSRGGGFERGMAHAETQQVRPPVNR